MLSSPPFLSAESSLFFVSLLSRARNSRILFFDRSDSSSSLLRHTSSTLFLGHSNRPHRFLSVVHHHPRFWIVFNHLCFQAFIFFLTDTCRLLYRFSDRLILALQRLAFDNLRSTFTCWLRFRLVISNSKTFRDPTDKPLLWRDCAVSPPVLLVLRVILEQPHIHQEHMLH